MSNGNNLADALGDPRGGQRITPGTQLTVNLEFFIFPGYTRDIAADVSRANEIYRSCNIRFQYNGNDVHRIDPDQASVWLGPDHILDISGIRDLRVSNEEQRMVDMVRNAFQPWITHVLVYGVRMMRHGMFEPSGQAYIFGLGKTRSVAPGLVLPNLADRETLAHELGHVLLNQAGHSSHDRTLLMHRVADGRGTRITSDQCRQMRETVRRYFL